MTQLSSIICESRTGIINTTYSEPNCVNPLPRNRHTTPTYEREFKSLSFSFNIHVVVLWGRWNSLITFFKFSKARNIQINFIANDIKYLLQVLKSTNYTDHLHRKSNRKLASYVMKITWLKWDLTRSCWIGCVEWDIRWTQIPNLEWWSEKEIYWAIRKAMACGP